jgi:hypothetical protein
VEPTMRAFSYSLLKLVEVLKELISLGSVYEEEDHQPLICGFRYTVPRPAHSVAGIGLRIHRAPTPPPLYL